MKCCTYFHFCHDLTDSLLDTKVSLWTDYIFVVIAIDRLMDVQTTTHGLKSSTKFPPPPPIDVIGSFSSKTRMSLKTQLLMFLEHSNFPAFSLPESSSQKNKFSKNSLHSRISIICDCAYIAFCFPSLRPIFAVRPPKVYCSEWNVQ